MDFATVNEKDVGFKITESEVTEEGMHTVIIRGRLETTNSELFTRCVLEYAEGIADGSRLILDMEKVPYISSTGIGSLTNILVQLKKKEIMLILQSVSESMKQVMMTLGFYSFFTIIDKSP